MRWVFVKNKDNECVYRCSHCGTCVTFKKGEELPYCKFCDSEPGVSKKACVEQATVNLGDVFYCIERVKTYNYYNPCKVCEGVKTLTVNGVTFPCPMCNSEKIQFSVSGYKVKRYRVFSITEEIPHSDWKKDISHKSVKYGLYHKHGKGSPNLYSANSLYDEKVFRESDFSERNFLNREALTERLYSSYIFSDYALAVTCADSLNKASRDLVAEYNKIHGTNFETPVFNIEHDKKSQ